MMESIKKEIEAMEVTVERVARAETKIDILKLIDEWYTLAPQYRTKSKLKKMIIEL